MAGPFVISETCDIVSFYRKKIFSGTDQIIKEYIERGDMEALRFHILQYMDTTVYIHKPPRPPTPRVPRLFIRQKQIESKLTSPPINIPGNFQ